MLLTRHFDNSLSVYLFLQFEPKLGKSEKFNNQGMKENKADRIPFITKKTIKRHDGGELAENISQNKSDVLQ